MDPPIAGTASGRLRGISASRDVWAFLGIPYAAPPVGALRWRPPQPAEGWTGVRDAATFAPDPIQPPGNGKRTSRAPSMSEDCLYLNVWAPKQRRSGGWPVLVWSGGGAFTTGGGAFAEEDPAALAAEGAVVVSINTRLNVFGFLAHPALTAESPHHSSGNYGLLDHAAAFRWVRENIDRFGGDGLRVTFLGESAGATSGLLLLASPLAATPYDRAVLLSPGAFNSMLPREAAERHGAGLGDSAEAIRSIPAKELLARAALLPAVNPTPWLARPLRPIVDGWVVVQDDPFAAGAFQALPAIIGNNEDEGRFFRRRMAVDSVEDYLRFVHANFGEHAEEVLRRYPVQGDSQVPGAFSALFGDRCFMYPIDRLIRAFARRQPDTYRYVYSYRHGGSPLPPTHSEEIGTLMHTSADVTPADGEMADIMAKYWLAFADTGHPNPGGLPEWPRFDEAAEQYLKLDVPPAAGSRWRSDEIRFASKSVVAS